MEGFVAVSSALACVVHACKGGCLLLSLSIKVLLVAQGRCAQGLHTAPMGPSLIIGMRWPAACVHAPGTSAAPGLVTCATGIGTSRVCGAWSVCLMVPLLVGAIRRHGGSYQGQISHRGAAAGCCHKGCRAVVQSIKHHVIPWQHGTISQALHNALGVALCAAVAAMQSMCRMCVP